MKQLKITEVTFSQVLGYLIDFWEYFHAVLTYEYSSLHFRFSHPEKFRLLQI